MELFSIRIQRTFQLVSTLQGRALVAKEELYGFIDKETGKSFPVFMNVSRRLPHTKPMR